MRCSVVFTIVCALASCAVCQAHAQEVAPAPASSMLPLPDGCMDLDHNDDWNARFAELTSNYKAKDFPAALTNAQAMNSICDRSPVLNFAIGRIYREMGDDTKGLYYMQRATMFTEEFQVRGELLERMWYERYEIEHVDARQANIDERKKRIEDQQNEIELLKTEVQKRDAEMLEYKAQTTLERNTSLMAERSHYAAGLWSGVAIGGIGIVLAIAGGVLMYTEKDKAVEFSDEERKGWVQPKAYLYTSMFAGGLGLTVAGTVVAGIMGYHYSRTPVPDSDLEFAFGPTGATLSFNF